MGITNDDEGYPAQPGIETKLRYAKNRETTRGEDDLTLEPLNVKIGDEVNGYVLEQVIGSGVTSTVFRVREVETGRKLALKVLRSRSEETLAASRIGFSHMSKIRHPSLVKLYRIVPVGKCVGFVMEEVVGSRLLDLFVQNRTADRTVIFDLAKRLIRDLGGALEAMHDAGFVHRDVKPENVLIDKTGRARLVDYGLIGTFDPVSDPDARRNYLAGTIWYMAPESISEQMYPPACDVYAVGCVVLELIADRAQLPQETLGQSFGHVIGDIRSFLPKDTPPELADLLCDMLDPAAANRPVASRLAHFFSQDASPLEAPTQFRRSRFRGREREMAIAEQWVHSVVGGQPTRLHISGESGVGKTWFVSELLRRIRSNPWFQVFDSACREREDVSLQAFDAMADAIARRYSREDREPIKLSPKHALILRQAFPSLRAVILEPQLTEHEWEELNRESDFSPSDHSHSTDLSRVELARSDALQSGVELVNQMCAYGPLFLVYDDIQWADQDSINVLDKLLTDCRGEVGLITIGRSREHRFRHNANTELELRPLTQQASVDLLKEMLRTRAFTWDERALARLAALGEGNAYRLTQLAACISHDEPSHWQERLLAGPVALEDIWNVRLQKISSDAMVALQYLAIAGGPVHPGALALVSGQMERSDDVCRELAELQLITESHHRDLVDIIHQRLSQRILDGMESRQVAALHQAWANYLMGRAHDQWRSAKIAGHLINAGQHEEAVTYAIQAAQDAEDRFAFTEAGRWHQRVSDLVPGVLSGDHLTKALECFEKAGRPTEAVTVCRRMIELSASANSSESILRIRLRLATNLLHQGAMEEAFEEIESAATNQDSSERDDHRKALPLNRLWRNIYRSIQRTREPFFSPNLEDAPPFTSVDAGATVATFYRPLVTLDAERANRILRNVVLSATAPKPEIQVQTAVDLAVLGCVQPGRRRKRNTRRLEQLAIIAEQSPCSKLKGAVNGGIALRHLLACDWASSISSATKSIELLRNDRMATRFDDAYARLPLIWSYLWLGRLNDLRRMVDITMGLAQEFNDQYLSLVATAGVGSAASLVSDDLASHRQYSRNLSAFARRQRSPWMRVFQSFAPIMRWLYQGETIKALRYHSTLNSGERRAMMEAVQLPRILEQQLHGLIHLRLAFEKPIYRNESLAIVRAVCESLNEEQVPYAKTVAKFYAAQAHELMADRERCIELYNGAADAADSLDLIPFRLASLDRISIVQNDKPSNELNRFLNSEGVKFPEKFTRLYSGLS